MDGARQFGTAGLDVATGLAVDATGSVVAVGYSMAVQHDGFVQRLTSTGTLAGTLEVIAAAVNPAQSSRDTRPQAVASGSPGGTPGAGPGAVSRRPLADLGLHRPGAAEPGPGPGTPAETPAGWWRHAVHAGEGA